VGIEVNQRQRAMAAGVGLEQRVADEVVAAQGEHGATGLKECVRLGLDAVRHRMRRAAVEGQSP
jgi:hypothetical protein